MGLFTCTTKLKTQASENEEYTINRKLFVAPICRQGKCVMTTKFTIYWHKLIIHQSNKPHVGGGGGPRVIDIEGYYLVRNFYEFVALEKGG